MNGPSRALGAALAVVLAVAAGAGGARAAGSAGPRATIAPLAVGAPVVGQRLTAEVGAWSGASALAFHVQWYRCDGGVAHCSSIHGATGRSYRLVLADVGHTLALTVSATDTSGTASAYAGAVGPVAAASAPLVSTVQPGTTGTVAAGNAVAVDPGWWSAKASALTYAWLRCNANGRLCATIAGATAASYTATSADAGHALVPVVTATAGTAQATALGEPVRPASTTTAGGPTAGTAPTVSGLPVQGAKLTATAGTWAGTGTIAYAYQWYRCDTAGAHCLSVHGATAATYTLAAVDAGHTIGLAVTATDGKGATHAYAGLVGPVLAAGASLAPTALPVVSGTATVGKPLTVSTGTWSKIPSVYAYVWERCNANGRLCAAIAGATSATYTLTSADAGHRLLVAVTATAGAATAETLSSSVEVR